MGILKRSQASFYDDKFPFDVFNYADMCKGVRKFLVQLQYQEKIGDSDKVCDVMYSYM